jgi:hypothetical protein
MENDPGDTGTPFYLPWLSGKEMCTVPVCVRSVVYQYQVFLAVRIRYHVYFPTHSLTRNAALCCTMKTLKPKHKRNDEYLQEVDGALLFVTCPCIRSGCASRSS